MNLYIKNALVYRNGKFKAATVTVKNGKIAVFDKPNTNAYPELDCGGNYLCPGFIDVHSHGGAGTDVNLIKDENDLEKLSLFHLEHGTTAFLASVLTDSEKQTLKILKFIKAYKEADRSGAQLLGAHLEGPFLSKEKKGAMPEKYLKNGDISLFERYLQTGVVKYITIAPECEGNMNLIRYASRFIPVAIGHSAADYNTAVNAVVNGAVAATHTFNGMLGFDRLEPNILGAVLDMDIFSEIIADGVHSHPAAVRLLYNTKGNKKLVAITDSIMAAGEPDGEYYLGANRVCVKGADAFIKGTRVRAGSVLTMDAALKNLMNFLNLPLEKTLPMLTENPADLLKLKKGYIKRGYDADFAVLDAKYNVVNTVVSGVPSKK